jgi:hypothetical protein
MLYFIMGFFFGGLTTLFIAVNLYEFHEMNEHPERFRHR